MTSLDFCVNISSHLPSLTVCIRNTSNKYNMSK